MRRRNTSRPEANRERAVVLGLVALLMMLVLVGRLFTLQVVFGQRYLEYSERNWLRPKRLPGQRGRILDRHGAVLADVVPAFTVHMDSQHEFFSRDAQAKVEVVRTLAELLGEDSQRFENALQRSRSYSYAPLPLVRNADLATVTLVEENRSRLPGVFVEASPMRFYPRDSLAAHTLGYVQEVTEADLERLGMPYRPGSMIGRTGAESQYETELRGVDGVRFIEVSAVGRRSEAFLEIDPVQPSTGDDMVLSLDLELQRQVEAAMDAAPFDADGAPPEVRGAAIVLDLRTGDILAMASRPTYDPNLFPRGFSQAEWGRINRPGRPLFHRAIKGRYPPASTFKGLTLYGPLESGRVTVHTKLGYCNGGWTYGNRYFRCWRAGGHGKVNAIEAMAHSCDTYFYQLGAELGVTGIRELAQRFRIHEPTGVDLPGEAGGMVPDKAWYDEQYGLRGWSRGVALNLSIGQGELQLTPLQLAVFTGVLATGKRVQPRLLLQAGDRVAPIPEAQDLGLNPAFLRVVQQGMRAAVEWGTAQSVQFDEVAVAAKTGTAENAGEDHAVFMTYAPYEDPQIATLVYLENRGHGGAVGGPVTRRILAAYFGLDLGPPPKVEGD